MGYKCPECGETDRSNFTVRMPDIVEDNRHSPGGGGHNPRSSPRDNVTCDSCGHSFKSRGNDT